MVIQECRFSINMLLTFIWEILKCIWSVLMKSMLFCPSQILPCGILSEKCPLRLRNLNTWFPVDNVVGEALEPFGGRLLMEKVCPWVEKRLCILIYSLFPLPLPHFMWRCEHFGSSPTSLPAACCLPAKMASSQFGDQRPWISLFYKLPWSWCCVSATRK